jgi:ATP-dependent DNA ligase
MSICRCSRPPARARCGGEWAAEPKLDGWRALVTVADDNVDFYALGQRMLTRKASRSVTFCAFDVLWLNGIDRTQLPYRDRRRMLEMLEMLELKRLDARYMPGVRTDVWRKVRTSAWRREHAPRRVLRAGGQRVAAQSGGHVPWDR